MDNGKAVLIAKALADANRVEILSFLKEGELCACRLLERFSISQPTLSHHMKILCDAGLVTVRKEGKWSHYMISAECLADFKAYIEGFI